MQGSSSKSPIGVPQQLISRGVCAAALALTLIGAGILTVATHSGIGIYTDSIVYIGAARSFLAGDGFQYLTDIGQFSPITQYPPGYPWLIAAFAWMGLDPLDSARWISIFFCAGNSLLIAYIVLCATASFGAMLLAVFLSFAAFPMVYINSQALSEPPFIFLILLGYCFLARYLRESHAASIYWFALAIGLSCLVRYVGIAFGMTGAAVILFHGRDDWRKRYCRCHNLLHIVGDSHCCLGCQELLVGGQRGQSDLRFSSADAGGFIAFDGHRRLLAIADEHC